MKITGSKAHRPWVCPPSAVLPQSVDVDREEELEPLRDRGRIVHAYLETVRAKGRDVALLDVPDAYRPLCEALELDNLPAHLATEVALAWNWVEHTARELGRNLGHRDYDALGVDWSCEVPMTLDAVGLARPRGYVGDYKTGHAKYPTPDRYAQTLLGACCLWKLYDLEDCVVELLRIKDDGGHFPVRRIVDAFDLQAFADSYAESRLAIRHVELEGARPHGLEYTEGEHCKYCPAFTQCEKKLQLVRAVPQELERLGVEDDFDGPSVRPGAITHANAAQAFEWAERVEAAIKRLKAQVCGLAKATNTPIPLSDGRIIEMVETKSRDVDGRVAVQVLERRYGREQAMKDVTVSIALGDIRKIAARNRAEGEKIETKNRDGAFDKVLADIERAGGLAYNVSRAWKPHTPRRK